MGLIHFPYEDRLPRPGDVAEVLLVDLETGEERVIADTRGWDTQLGAHIQWGADDTQLFYNDLDIKSWEPYGVRMNPLTGEKRRLGGTVYMVSPDGQSIISPDLIRARVTQEGYGVVVPLDRIRFNVGAPADDGLILTDAQTGSARRVISMQEVVEKAIPRDEMDLYSDGAFYAAHVKWNSKSDRFLLVMRWLRLIDEPLLDRRFDRVNLVTISKDGSDVHVAIPHDEWGVKGGGHPGWHPDGEHVIINLDIRGEGQRFVKARYDGTGLESLSDAVFGGGHPSLHRDGIHMVTDGYGDKRRGPNDGTNVVRLCDLAAGTEQNIVSIVNRPPFMGDNRQFRVDVHPAWDFAQTRISFQGCPDGTRRIYVADLAGVL